jgi:membrane protease subunit (stomatin/prohibitin family)
MDNFKKQSLFFRGIYEFDDSVSTFIAVKVPYYGAADLYSGTAILVKPNQCAMLIYKGQITDILGEGLHVIKTENFPIITRLANWQFGFQSPLKCEIWFFSKSVFTARRWGTAHPVIRDFPNYNAVPIRACGIFNIVLTDPEKVFRNLIGNKANYDITDLESFVQGKITELLPQALAVVPSLETLNSSQKAVSSEAKRLVNDSLKEFGFEIIDLQVMGLVPSQEVLQALDSKVAMDVIGNEQEYLIYKLANSLLAEAKSGQNTRANDPMQMMLGFMLSKNLFKPDYPSKEKSPLQPVEVKENAIPHKGSVSSCSKCKAEIGASDKFCPQCGNKLK